MSWYFQHYQAHLKALIKKINENNIVPYIPECFLNRLIPVVFTDVEVYCEVHGTLSKCPSVSSKQGYTFCK